MDTQRSGVIAGGNFIVDHVKIIDHYPQQDMLASIESESQANGGGPYNVLKDLAAMQAGYPLSAIGLVGDDADGRWILADCLRHGIETSQLHRTREAATSYTDAMTVRSTGKRTFFHQRGANALLDVTHFNFRQSTARHFHLGYLMLLDRLDTFDASGRTRAANVLAMAKEAGMSTSLDLVSTDHPRFRPIVESALPFTDHLIVNEIEAARVLECGLDAGSVDALADAAAHLLGAGARLSATIHTEHGAVGVTARGEVCVQPSLKLPEGFCQGATGAGDAFAAGLIHGLHEEVKLAERMLLAVCAAASSLRDPTPSAGVLPLPECLALADQFGFTRF